MHIQCGDYQFLSRDKSAAFIQVIEGFNNLQTMSRKEAEKLFLSLRKQGYGYQEVTSSSHHNDNMGNILVGRHW